MSSALPQWLYVLRLVPRLWETTGWTDRDAQIVSEHFAYLQNLCTEGSMLVVGRTHVSMKDNIGLAIFQAETEEAAREIMNNDPVVMNNLMTAEIFPYNISLLGRAVREFETT